MDFLPHPLLSALGGGALTALNARQLGRKRPRLDSISRTKSTEKLYDAFDKVVDENKPGKEVIVQIQHNTPAEGWEGTLDVLQNMDKYASSSKAGDTPAIKINPNADRAFLAHELGHIASQQSDIGYLINALRNNPKLSTALGATMFGLPILSSAITPGDEDHDTAIALATLTQIPTLIDEGLATKEGLKIMDIAGQRASLGQRGKLAGGLLSYLAAPVLIGTAGAGIGNLLDEDA